MTLRVYAQIDFAKDVFENADNYRPKSSEKNFYDLVFENEMNKAIKLTYDAYDK